MTPHVRHHRRWEILVETFRRIADAAEGIQSGQELVASLDVDSSYLRLAADLIERAYGPAGFQDFLFAIVKVILEPGGDDLKVQREKTLRSLAEQAKLILHEKEAGYGDSMLCAGRLPPPPDWGDSNRS